MKFCINYAKSSDVKDIVDEIIIRYENDIQLIINYIKEHQFQRVIIAIDDEEQCLLYNLIKKFAKIKEETEIDFSIRLPRYIKDYEDDLKYCQKVKLSYFFNTFVKDWDTLNGLIDLDVSDLYIVENMGFELDKIADLVAESQIQIRVFANIAQSSWKDTPDIKKFFIRPEDVKLYEPYIDVIEFFGSQDQIDVAVLVYKKGKQWFGDLSEILIDFDTPINSLFIVRDFAKRRIRCGKKCMKGDKCNLCDRIVTLSQTLEKAGIMIKSKKEEDING